MASVVFYFQVHQPYRLRRYSVFDSDPLYFDDSKNAEICRKVAGKCYLPATRLMLDLVRRHRGEFRISYSISGTALEQFESYCPEVIGVFRELAETGCCEFLAETYHHSLVCLNGLDEFVEQVDLHGRKVRSLFGQTPTVFRNTELVYSNALARELSSMKDENGQRRFFGALCEGTDRHLAGRSPAEVYRPPAAGGEELEGRGGRPFGLLLKNYRLSDDIAFRFSNRGWAEWPLTPEKFAAWVGRTGGLCNLFMDYETFGEHQWADTGIFRFLELLPQQVLDGKNTFLTASQALVSRAPSDELDVPEYTSWADTERDLSAWRGNAMQSGAMDETFALGVKIREKAAKLQGAENKRRWEAAQRLLDDWRRLTTSDHFYYMCTKYFADGDVHKYFNPYDSPYDSYINFMNVLDNVRTRLAQ
ncbi:MAG: glycoside hydrolase family 57 protein [Phycisphaerales bacterium]|nr:glycoside hydrolase family 57 protein [Planctomycetota bacterium]